MTLDPGQDQPQQPRDMGQVYATSHAYLHEAVRNLINGRLCFTHLAQLDRQLEMWCNDWADVMIHACDKRPERFPPVRTECGIVLEGAHGPTASGEAPEDP